MKQKLATYCAQCVSRCGCLASVENGVLKRIDKLPHHPTGQGLCVKGRAAPEIVYHKARLLTPLKRTNPKGALDPGWQAIGWDEALATIANKLTQFKSRSGAESVCWGITTPSATAIVDSFAWIQRLAHAFGSPNKLFATENCNWHKDFSHGFTHGQGIGMPEFDKSDLILLWGVNPEVTWPAQAELIKQAQKRGAQLVVIDPRKAGLARKADLWLGVKPGTDGVLALALANHLIASDCYDKAFMGQYSNGPLLVKEDGRFLTQADLEPLDKVNAHCLIALSSASSQPVLYDPKLKRYQSDEALLLEGEFELGGSLWRTVFSHYRQACEPYSLTKAQQITGVPAKQIEAIAQSMARTIENKGAISYFSWTGVAQQSQATQITRAIATLYGLTGALDKPGGNLYFTKPKVANLMGFELLSKGQKEKALGEGHSLGPGQKGWVNSTRLYQSCVLKKPYKTRALIAFGGNPIATKPNEAMIRQTLEALEFYVHADLFINESARYADIVLPVATSWERSGLSAGFQISQLAESWLQLRQPVIEPRGESKADTWIVFELAKLLGLAEHFFGGDPEEGLQALLEPSGIDIETLKASPEGINLQLTTRYQKYRHDGFATPTGLYEIYSEAFLQAGYAPVPCFDDQADDEEFPLLLTSAKQAAHCHSQHKDVACLNRRMKRPQIEINTELANSLGVSDGEEFTVETRLGQLRGVAKLDPDLAKGVLCAQYGWQLAMQNYNAIASEQNSDPISGSNPLKRQACRIVS